MTGKVQQIKIYNGISVETIQRNGTEAQKVAVKLYDEDRNGKLEGSEAEQFSNTTCELERAKDGLNKLKLTLAREDGQNQVTEITYRGPGELYGGENYTDGYCTMFNGKNKSFSIYGQFKHAIIDLVKGLASVRGGGSDIWVDARNYNVKIENSDAKYITMQGGQLELKNTKNYGKLWNSATQVETDGKTIIRADKNSEYGAEVNDELK